MIDFLSQHAGMIGLLFFFTFFILMAAWIYRPGAKEQYRKKSHIPLNEDMNHE
ncbi:MAG: cbb3-type cytochrome c oxidase subunit 3 [Micavibrio sp.]